MKNYLFDTSAYSQMVRGNKQVAHLLQSADRVYVSLVTVAELEYGFQNGSRAGQNRSLLTRFLQARKIKLLIPDRLTTSVFADIGTKTRRKGVQLAHHDLWLAAQAVQHNLTLVTFDKDFAPVQYPKFKCRVLRQG